MKLLLYFNAENPRFVEVAQQLQSHLAQFDVLCTTDRNAQDCDILCAIGGDGTILDAAEIALEREMPVFGLNAGRVGFLAAFDVKDIPSMTKQSIEQLYESRRDVIVMCTEDGSHRETAINDFVFAKQDVAKTVEMEISYDGKSLGGYRCDGIIISTATGSTAYSMSAGGPVVLPDVPAIVVTPICAYNAAQRSVLLPVDTTIKLTLSPRPDEAAVLVADGRIGHVLKSGESVYVTRYEKQLKLLLSHERDVYELLAGTRKGGA